jgi:hypothetical protein
MKTKRGSLAKARQTMTEAYNPYIVAEHKTLIHCAKEFLDLADGWLEATEGDDDIYDRWIDPAEDLCMYVGFLLAGKPEDEDMQTTESADE